MVVNELAFIKKQCFWFLLQIKRHLYSQKCACCFRSVQKCLRARGLNVFIFLILAFVLGKLTVPQGPVRQASNLVACDWYILYESIMGHNNVSCQLTIHGHIHSNGKFAERLHDILVGCKWSSEHRSENTLVAQIMSRMSLVLMDY